MSTLLVTKETLSTWAKNPKLVAIFPALSAAGIKAPVKSCCGSAKPSQASQYNKAIANLMSALSSLSPAKIEAIKKLINVDQLKILIPGKGKVTPIIV